MYTNTRNTTHALSHKIAYISTQADSHIHTCMYTSTHTCIHTHAWTHTFCTLNKTHSSQQSHCAQCTYTPNTFKYTIKQCSCYLVSTGMLVYSGRVNYIMGRISHVWIVSSQSCSTYCMVSSTMITTAVKHLAIWHNRLTSDKTWRYVSVWIKQVQLIGLHTHYMQLVSGCHVMSCTYITEMLAQAKTVALHIDVKQYHFNYREVQHHKL